MRKPFSWLALLLVVTLLCNCFYTKNPIPSQATSTIFDEVLLRKLEIYNQYQTMMNLAADTSNLFDVNPSVSSPYSTGQVKEDVLNSALRMTNFIRYLAYLSTDVQMDTGWNDMAQHTTVLLAANDKLSHTPTHPSNMSNGFFQLGYDGAQSSNLHWHYGIEISLDEVISGFMYDSDTRNIDRVGHRRWILNPAMTTVGFGVVDNYDFYAAMKVNGDDLNKVWKYQGNYDYVAWPSKTAFPFEFFGNDYAWSISLNEKKYDNTKISELVVTLKNLRTGTSQKFSKNQTGGTNYYYRVDTEGYGTPYCVIFRPDAINYQEGDQYEVSLSGIYTLDGKKTSISYKIEFFSVENFNATPSYADTLNKMGVLLGSSNGLELERTPTRIEGLIVLLRLLGKEEEALALKDEECQFLDVPDWARGYVNYAFNHKITKGISEKLFGSADLIDAKSFMTFMLRALGYDDSIGDFSWEFALDQGRDLNIINQEKYFELKEELFIRDDVAYITYYTLLTNKKGQQKTLLAELIEQGVIGIEFANLK